MKNTDKARSKEFGFVIIMEHASDNTVDSREKAVVIRQIKRCLFRQIKTGLSEHLTMG